MITSKNFQYETPLTEVIEVEVESGLLVGSVIGDAGDGGKPGVIEDGETTEL